MGRFAQNSSTFFVCDVLLSFVVVRMFNMQVVMHKMSFSRKYSCGSLHIKSIRSFGCRFRCSNLVHISSRKQVRNESIS